MKKSPAQALDEFFKSQIVPTEIPEGSFTQTDYAKRVGLQKSQTRARLKQLVEDGVLRKMIYKTPSGTYGVYYTPIL